MRKFWKRSALQTAEQRKRAVLRQREQMEERRKRAEEERNRVQDACGESGHVLHGSICVGCKRHKWQMTPAERQKAR